VVVLWAVAGWTSADDAVCVSCHPDNPHAAAAASDPHVAVACVACHEPGGAFARVTINATTRFEHFVLGSTDTTAAAAYGRPVSSYACRGCHGSPMNAVTVDETRGVKVSHAEPLAAGAECVDCHVLVSGVLTKRTVGMAPCLRCHTGSKVSVACATCHIGDPALAARATEPTGGTFAKRLVTNPRCGGCHLSQASCDHCHGIRMPHSEVFMAYGHARAAALDIWDNGGRMCRKCHYEGNRDCGKCHYSFPSHPSDFKSTHTFARWGEECGCHGWDARARGILFCQVCHPSRPPGAR
jgi:hypothetical protein